MSNPAFYTDNHEPRRTATKLEVLNKILGAILDLGVVDTTNPVFYTDGCVPRRDATELEVLNKILGALIGLGAGGGGGVFIPRTGPDVATSELPYAASLVIDFDGPGKQQVNATGNLVLSTTNRGNGKFVTLRIVASPGPINISVDSDIHKIGTFSPTLPAGKIAWITFFSNGPAESDTDAVYREET